MADNNQTSNNTQSSQQASQAGNQNNSTATNSGWVTVNTSDSAEAQRMNIMKGNENDFFTKSGK